MSAITTKDFAVIHYKDRGEVRISRSRMAGSLNADAWDGQMLLRARP